jgi:hypothetical protein
MQWRTVRVSIVGQGAVGETEGETYGVLSTDVVWFVAMDHLFELGGFAPAHPWPPCLIFSLRSSLSLSLIVIVAVAVVVEAAAAAAAIIKLEC